MIKIGEIDQFVKLHPGDALVPAGCQIVDLAAIRAKYGHEVADEVLRQCRAEIARRHAVTPGRCKPTAPVENSPPRARVRARTPHRRSTATRKAANRAPPDPEPPPPAA